MLPSSDDRFRRLFDAHRDGIRAYCFRRLSPEDANDATAEVFLVVWRKIDQVPAGEAARLWIYGIARNVVRNQLRSVVRRDRLAQRLISLPSMFEPDVSVAITSSEEDRILLDSISRLRPSDQELLRLRSWEGLASAEIAVVTGLSVRAVESRLSRIRRRLADQMERANPSQPPMSAVGEEG